MPSGRSPHRPSRRSVGGGGGVPSSSGPFGAVGAPSSTSGAAAGAAGPSSGRERSGSTSSPIPPFSVGGNPMATPAYGAYRPGGVVAGGGGSTSPFHLGAGGRDSPSLSSMASGGGGGGGATVGSTSLMRGGAQRFAVGASAVGPGGGGGGGGGGGRDRVARASVGSATSGGGGGVAYASQPLPYRDSGSNLYRNEAAASDAGRGGGKGRRRRSRTPPRRSDAKRGGEAADRREEEEEEEGGGVLGTGIPSATRGTIGSAKRPSRRNGPDRSPGRGARFDRGGGDGGRGDAAGENVATNSHDGRGDLGPSKDPSVNGAHRRPAPPIAEKSQKKRPTKVETLRLLTLSSLGASSSSLVAPDPSTAVFYGSVLLSLTRLPSDAFLYARALAANDEGRRAVRALENAGLLSNGPAFPVGGGPWPGRPGGWASRGDDDATGRGSDGVAAVDPALRVEAAVLAARCLSSAGEWEDAVAILEEACRYPLPGAGAARGRYSPGGGAVAHWEAVAADASIIDDGDDPRLLLLAESIRPVGGDLEAGGVHPLSRLLTLRAIAYDELSNPARSAAFLRAALRIDARCVEAMRYGFERHLFSTDEEWDLVKGLDLRGGREREGRGGGGDDDDSDGGGGGLDWLKDLYVASLSAAPEFLLPADPTAAGSDGPPASSSPPSIILGNSRHDARAVETPDLTFVRDVGTATTTTRVDASSTRMDDDGGGVARPDSMAISPPVLASAGRGGIGTRGARLAGIDDDEDDEDDRKLPAAPPPSPLDEIESALRRLSVDHSLSDSPEVLALAARRSYDRHDLRSALSYCDALAAIDPVHPSVAYVHVATLVGLGHKRSLFRLAHRLVDADPKSPRSWYAVGCYYHLSRKPELAQRHLCRAVRLGPRIAEAWIGFGCAFASSDESDQALASFRAAGRLNPGSHLPTLYMGMEYLRTNHLSLAGHFLRTAGKACSGPSGSGGDDGRRRRGRGGEKGTGGGGGGGGEGGELGGGTDPLCWNELGVWRYRRGEYVEAIGLFLSGLRIAVEAAELNSWEAEMEEEEDGRRPEEDRSSERRGGDRRPTEEAATSSSSVRFEPRDGGDGRARARRGPRRRRHPGSSDAECIDLCRDPFWEPTIFNLGQAYRKARRYDEAAVCFEKCLSLCPGNASSHAALGFARHLAGDVDSAIESYHRALSRRPDEPFASEMLHRALRESLSASSLSSPGGGCGVGVGPATAGPSGSSATFRSGDDLSYGASASARGGGTILLSPRPPLSEGGSAATATPRNDDVGATPQSTPFMSPAGSSAASASASASVPGFSSSSDRRYRGGRRTPAEARRRSDRDASMATTDDGSNFTMDSADADVSMT